MAMAMANVSAHEEFLSAHAIYGPGIKHRPQATDHRALTTDAHLSGIERGMYRLASQRMSFQDIRKVGLRAGRSSGGVLLEGLLRCAARVVL